MTDTNDGAAIRRAGDDFEIHPGGDGESTGGSEQVTARAAPQGPSGVHPRAPDFFVVGQPKSGTTALYEMLKRHPEVFIPDRKEPRFFATELYVRDPPRPGGTPETLADYLPWFEAAGTDQRIGDASPWYLWSQAAAGLIAGVQPSARIIAIMREPASFLRSLHMQFVQLYVETETDLRKAIALEGRRREGLEVPRHTYWPQMLLYSEHVRMVEQLKRYAAVFPPEQMMVLVYDDFRRDNEETCRRVLRFLGVDESFPIEAAEVNPTVRVRSRRMHELVHAVSVGHGPLSRAVKASIKTVTPGRLRRPALYAAKRRVVFAEPEPPDEELMTELRRRFKPEVVALSEYLGRDLVALWGYDRLD
jgi:hypothetical protein